jgi:hypothetical protein
MFTFENIAVLPAVTLLAFTVGRCTNVKKVKYFQKIFDRKNCKKDGLYFPENEERRSRG